MGLSLPPLVHRTSLTLDHLASFPLIFGENGLYLRLIEEKFGVTANFRGEQLTLSSDNPENIDISKTIVLSLYERALKNSPLFSKEEFLHFLEWQIKKKTLLPDISVTYFQRSDSVRHLLVLDILSAFSHYEHRRQALS